MKGLIFISCFVFDANHFRNKSHFKVMGYCRNFSNKSGLLLINDCDDCLDLLCSSSSLQLTSLFA